MKPKVFIENDYVAAECGGVRYMATKDRFTTMGRVKDLDLAVTENDPAINLIKGLSLLDANKNAKQ